MIFNCLGISKSVKYFILACTFDLQDNHMLDKVYLITNANSNHLWDKKFKLVAVFGTLYCRICHASTLRLESLVEKSRSGQGSSSSSPDPSPI